MEFSVEHCKKSLDDNDARSSESSNSDRGSSSNSHCSEKLGDDDHVVRFDVKEILRRKLQGKQSTRATSCKVWHVPSPRQNVSPGFEVQLVRVPDGGKLVASINCLNSPVLHNIKKGMALFEK